MARSTQTVPDDCEGVDRVVLADGSVKLVQARPPVL